MTHVPPALQGWKDEGGIKLLNLRHRNDAIELVLLKEYLSKNSTRPMWAYMMDILSVPGLCTSLQI